MTSTHNRALQDQDPEGTHRIVVFSAADDAHQLRDLLVEWLGLTTVDAQIQVHSLPGVLPNLLTTHDAAQLAAAIRELGADATIVANDEVPHLKKVQTVHHARCNDAGLEILDLRGERKTVIDWQDVVLISVGLVSQQTQHLVGAPPTAMVQLANTHRSEQPVAVHHDSLELLIVTKNPTSAYRVDHAQMNYEYLGQRMSSSGTANFRRFVQDLVSRSLSANLTPATHSFLQHGFARHYQFRSSEELKRYTVFRLLVRDSPSTQVGDGARTPSTQRSRRSVKTPPKQKPTETDHAIEANT